jgi:hypothetical protein
MGNLSPTDERVELRAPDRFPTKPGDWVSDGHQVAQVKAVDWDGTEVVVDLVFYANNGEKLGRVSPAMGGPRTFEPSCSWRYWHRVHEPDFPIQISGIPEADGRVRIDYFHGDPLPERQWKKPVRRSKRLSTVRDEKHRRALEQIAAGHNDARGLAQSVLNQKDPP